MSLIKYKIRFFSYLWGKKSFDLIKWKINNLETNDIYSEVAIQFCMWKVLISFWYHEDKAHVHHISCIYNCEMDDGNWQSLNVKIKKHLKVIYILCSDNYFNLNFSQIWMFHRKSVLLRRKITKFTCQKFMMHQFLIKILINHSFLQIQEQRNTFA